MPITVIFRPSSMDALQYDEVTKRLEDAGAGRPQGRLYHVCFGEGTSLRVVEVWVSQDAFNAFGQVLLPILKEMEIDPGKPEVAEVYNIIRD